MLVYSYICIRLTSIKDMIYFLAESNCPKSFTFLTLPKYFMKLHWSKRKKMKVRSSTIKRLSLCEKCQNTELFSVRIREDTDQKKLTDHKKLRISDNFHTKSLFPIPHWNNEPKTLIINICQAAFTFHWCCNNRNDLSVQNG